MSTPTFLSLWRGEIRPRTKIACGAHAVRLAEEVAAIYGMTLEDLRSETKTRPFTTARQHAYAALRNTGLYSSTQVGKLLNRDHTSVLHGARRHRGAL
jgi:chromosomal replication initiation ATPase DnaA